MHHNRLFKLLIVIVASLMGLYSCNSDKSDYEPASASASTMVTSFSLTQDKKVLAGLDSIFFTIDLQTSNIYNADSLPYGTNTSRLIPIIITSAGVSVAEISFPRPNMPDSVVNYLTNSTDSIDFSNGPVKLRLVANNGMATQTYTIKVNVHQHKPDSLAWNRMDRTSLPSIFQVPSAQGTAQTASKIYCLTASGGRYCMASTDNPYANNWEKLEITLPFTPRPLTMRGTDSTLYILDTDDNLYSSTDGGVNWVSENKKCHYLYGAYNGSLLAAQNNSGKWQILTLPAGTLTDMPQGFPVEGSSLPIQYMFEMASAPQVLMTGGRTAEGTVIPDTWGFDGTSWAKISTKPIPAALEGAAVVPYFSFKVNSIYRATKYSALLAFCGRKADGSLNRTVYVSLDFGMTWKIADNLMQLPEYFPAMADAQGFTYSQELSIARSAGSWQSFVCPALPAAWSFLPENISRATKPVSEWECPYIYIFGGVNADDNLYNTVWRGVINRFTFIPIQ